jgi:Domain of Unknown Function (DUF1080)
MQSDQTVVLKKSDIDDAQFAMDQYVKTFRGLGITHLDALAHMSHGDTLYNGFHALIGHPSLSEEAQRRSARESNLQPRILFDIPALKGRPYLGPEKRSSLLIWMHRPITRQDRIACQPPYCEPDRRFSPINPGGIMNRRRLLKTGSLAVAGSILLPRQSFSQTAVPTLPASGADGWISLLNGRDLSGWYTMLQKAGKGAAEKRHMVTIEEDMLHILGNEDGQEPAEAGYLATNQEFENVHIRVEFKWGVKRFAPRTFTKRDNGLLYALVGEDKVWPTCIECQIEEGDVGDYFMVRTRGIQDTHSNGLFGEGLSPHGWSRPAAQRPMDPAKSNIGDSRKIKDGNFEILDGWNTVEVVWQGNRSAHIVNGRTVNAAYNLEQPDPDNPGSFIPLTRGKIAIEIEFAEIWFRNIEVKSLV